MASLDGLNASAWRAATRLRLSLSVVPCRSLIATLCNMPSAGALRMPPSPSARRPSGTPPTSPPAQRNGAAAPAKRSPPDAFAAAVDARASPFMAAQKPLNPSESAPAGEHAGGGVLDSRQGLHTASPSVMHLWLHAARAPNAVPCSCRQDNALWKHTVVFAVATTVEKSCSAVAWQPRGRGWLRTRRAPAVAGDDTVAVLPYTTLCHWIQGFTELRRQHAQVAAEQGQRQQRQLAEQRAGAAPVRRRGRQPNRSPDRVSAPATRASQPLRGKAHFGRTALSCPAERRRSS